MAGKKDIAAKLHNIRRKHLGSRQERTGTGSTFQHEYDDNVIRLAVKIHDGPANMLDRLVIVEVVISEFGNHLPPEVADRGAICIVAGPVDVARPSCTPQADVGAKARAAG